MVTINQIIQKKLSQNPKANIELIKRAYIFSKEAHCSQKRKEGTPYIIHPLEVANILTDMRLDSATIAAGLLHDTIEDTVISHDDIKSIFSPEIAFMVDALTKLNIVEAVSKEDVQAENFRKMLLAMSKDVRVILIKFADRLHNMRTIQFLPEHKKKTIASETLDIYAPLANRLGIGWLRTEFEDLSFKALHPEIYDEIMQKVTKRRQDQQSYIDEIAKLLSNRLESAGVPAKVKGRVKHIYGIYQKMQKQQIQFEQIHDVLGLRIITDTVGHCYDILGIIHSMWHLVPGRFKDFISLPKSNMYQSLHTTVIGPGGDRVEFQIRTKDMDEIAEDGIAAHWRYKEMQNIDAKNAKFIVWLRELIKESFDAKEFLDEVKGEVTPDTIYVFTPKGDIKELPVGATPVDFAYSIHSEVGHRCVGAKVNGKMVPLRHILQSGDVVEIICSATHTPSRDWLKFVVTSRAKNRIKQWFKTEERAQAVTSGMQLLEDELKRHFVPVSVLKSAKADEICKLLGFQALEDMYAAIGFNKLSALQFVHKFVHEKQPEPQRPRTKVSKHKDSKSETLVITGVDNVMFSMAKCCYPVPGDSIIGFITKGKGVTIHRETCKSVQKLLEKGERIIPVSWRQGIGLLANAKLHIEAVDKQGLLANISVLISSMNLNITSIKAFSTNDKRAILEVIVQVADNHQFSTLIHKIGQMDGIINVSR